MSPARDPHGSPWSQTRAGSGAFTSIQRAALPAPAVEQTLAGAERLGALYWEQLERSTFGLVHSSIAGDTTELKVLGVGPALLRFGPPRYDVSPRAVTCQYPITGGVLARAPGGSISFTQAVGGSVEARSEIAGFFPRLAPRRLRRGWNGILYPHLQTRLHVAVGHRYFARLRAEAAA